MTDGGTIPDLRVIRIEFNSDVKISQRLFKTLLFTDCATEAPINICLCTVQEPGLVKTQDGTVQLVFVKIVPAPVNMMSHGFISVLVKFVTVSNEDLIRL